jgi:dihydrofolate reductase
VSEARYGSTVAKLICQISVSLDGYVAGPDPSEEDPLGKGGEQLHEWVFKLEAWRSAHGREGGEENASSQVIEEALSRAGAVIMGRRMFGGGPGPWGEPAWNGWWGEKPPFQVPVFVLTHHPREPLEMKGGTTFHFVTDGIESALQQATEAAGSKDVSLGGGAAAIQQYLVAGLLDELQLNLVPVLLGAGTPLFANLEDAAPRLQPRRVIAAPGVTHIAYEPRIQPIA